MCVVFLVSKSARALSAYARGKACRWVPCLPVQSGSVSLLNGVHAPLRAGAGSQEERQPEPGGSPSEDWRMERGPRRLQQGTPRK